MKVHKVRSNHPLLADGIICQLRAPENYYVCTRDDAKVTCIRCIRRLTKEQVNAVHR